MRKVRGALLALTLVFAGVVAGAPQASAGDNYTVSISDTSRVEGSPLSFVITAAPAPKPGDTIQVTATTSDGTATGGNTCPADDYFSQMGTVVLTSAAPSRLFNVQTCDDADQEGDETMFVQLGTPAVTCMTTPTPCSAILGDGTGLGTIRDNEPAAPTPTPNPTPSPTTSPGRVLQPTTLSVVDVVGPVGPAENCRFSVNRDGDARGLTRVNFASAGRPRKVTNVSGTLVFGPGETVKTVDVDVLHHVRRQKFVTLTLSGASNATITDAVGQCELKAKRHPRRRR